MRKILSTFLLVIIFIVGCTKGKTIEHIKYCEKNKEEIINIINELKSCDVDSDCFLDTLLDLGCPFGCYIVRSHQYDHGESAYLLERKVKQYHSECFSCEYDCIESPSSTDIECRDNKCIDNRFL